MEHIFNASEFTVREIKTYMKSLEKNGESLCLRWLAHEEVFNTLENIEGRVKLLNDHDECIGNSDNSVVLLLSTYC